LSSFSHFLRCGLSRRSPSFIIREVFSNLVFFFSQDGESRVFFFFFRRFHHLRRPLVPIFRSSILLEAVFFLNADQGPSDTLLIFLASIRLLFLHPFVRLRASPPRRRLRGNHAFCCFFFSPPPGRYSPATLRAGPSLHLPPMVHLS